MSIYQPAEDSYFFAEFLKTYVEKLPKGSTCLDMGTGSGILAQTAAEALGFQNIVACDINSQAVKNLENEKFRVVQSDLFSNINQKFDLIMFNAPYLPEDGREPQDSQLATTGGVRGDEVTARFLQQAFDYLKPNGKILLLISSLTPKDQIDTFKPKEMAKKRIFGEDLVILEFH